MGWEEGLVAVKCIFMVLGRFFLPKNPTDKCVVGGGCATARTTDGMAQNQARASSPMRLLVALLDHRQWYGAKPPAAMVGGKCDVSGETEVVLRGIKES